jgi:single-stranded DNA-binding protein
MRATVLKPQWVRTAVFGETAERIARTAKKGDKLYVEGNLTLL